MSNYIESLNYKDEPCRLVMMDCNVPILKGVEYVAASGDVYKLSGGVAPHKAVAAGKICTDNGDRFPSAILARWATIAECEEADDDEFGMRDFVVLLSITYEHLKPYNHTPHSAALVYFASLAAKHSIDNITERDLIHHIISGEPLFSRITSLRDGIGWIVVEQKTSQEMYDDTMRMLAEFG